MTKREKYECDVTGEVYGAKNAGDGVIEFEVRRHRNSSFEVSKKTVHISMDKLTEEVGHSYPTMLKYIGVVSTEDGEKIVGMCSGYRAGIDSDVHYEYDERGSYMTSSYEPFLEFVEREILY